MEVSTIIYLVLFFVVLLVLGGVVSRWRMKRAIRQVILIFREHTATGSRNAKTMDELGLRPQGMLGGMFRGRDYKQYAISLLTKSDVILTTEDGKLYISEDKLLASGIDKGASYSRY